MRIGIYGGTFSPPHIGHVAAARAFAEQLELDRLLIIPTYMPPHKSVDYDDDPARRFEMCRLAFSDIPNAEISDIELKRGGKSYTADTLAELSGEGRELFLLCGTDMILTLGEWYRPEEIFARATPVYIRRECDPETGRRIAEKLVEYKEKYRVDVLAVDAPVVEMASMDIRAALDEGRDISDMVTPEVKKYIFENGMYR